MSANPNVLTNEEILSEIQRFSQTTPNPEKKLKIGDQEYDANNLQALQTAIDAATSKNQSEFTTLRSEVEQLRNTRIVKPEENTPNPQTPPTNGLKPARKLTNKEWTDAFVEDPQRVFDESLARMLGVEGSGGEVLRGTLLELHQANQQAQLERNVILKKQQELAETVTTSQARTEAESFLASHPEFVIGNESRQIIESYLTDYGLPATEKNLNLVYTQAIADGKFANPNTQQTQQFTQQPVQRQGVPRLGGTSSGNVDERYMLEQANKLPTDQHYALLQRLKNGDYQR